jgi:hypothetical protein
MVNADLGHLNARKVQLNFTVDPKLFVRLDNFIKNNNSGSRSSVISLLIELLVSDEQAAKVLAAEMRPEQIGTVKHVGANVAAVLREGK